MSSNRIILSILIITVGIFSIMGGGGCANIIPPQGGPRDSIPPQLVKAEPGDSALNFKGNKIVLTFDEFVEVPDFGASIIFSPTPNVNPFVEAKLKTVSIKLKDSLSPNTTYTINFGSSIKDFTEGNFLKDFTYTFSTGNYIDSLELSGKVLLAETGKLDTTMIVMLHTSADDSVVVKEKPVYFSKLDGKGNFRFKNLPPKVFYLYALKDESNTKRYSSDKQMFAFADQPVAVKDNTDPVTLYAYVAVSAPETDNAGAAGAGKGIRINRKGVANDKSLKYSSNLSDGLQDLLNNFYLTMDQPLRNFDSTGLKLFTDSTYTPVADYSFSKDSSNKKIMLTHKWKENTAYHLILDKDFAEDTIGNKLLETDTLHFTTRKLTDYGSLKLKLRNLDLAKNPVLQIIQGDRIIKSFTMNSIDLTQDLFLPGEYELRILFDTNKNGIWDPGDFFGKHLQPEIVMPVERKITVKSAWQNEFEILL